MSTKWDLCLAARVFVERAKCSYSVQDNCQRFFSTLVDSHIYDTYNSLMGYRKGKDSSTESVISNTKGARILGLVFIVIGIAGLVLKLSGAGALFFILSGIGIILLTIGDTIILWVAVSLFAIALVSLGIALCRLLG